MTRKETKQAKQAIRLQALSELYRSHGSHNTHYASDLVYAASSLTLSDSPCVIVIRDYGIDYIDSVYRAECELSVFGERDGKVHWFIGEGSRFNCNYEFRRCTASEAIEFLGGIN